VSNIANHLRSPGDAKAIVIALHCSGASRSEWRQLGTALGHRFRVIALDLIGSGGSPHWTADRAFRLSDEAAEVVRIIDEAKRPVHLVGHSYGGCVALRAAFERPTQVASMALYEPVSFPILKSLGSEGKTAFEEFYAVAQSIRQLVLYGVHEAAAKRFFEYWSGEGSWAALRVEARNDLIRYIPKFFLEYSAVISERTPLYAYRRFNIPVLMLQGEHSPQSMQLISGQLAKAMKFASLQTVYGAGHMGPFTHAAIVNAMMTEWIVRAEPGIPSGEQAFDLPFDRVA